ncbi:hypothetical protein AAVH_30093 [Aphelenchoides avenae]|nr:hypothetical protein AAVH_30093 [Aphelenchus avenae]
MSNFGYFWTIVGGCCVVLLYNVSAYFGSYPSSDVQEELTEMLRRRSLSHDSYRCLIHCVYVLFMELACYALAIFCSLRIRSMVEKSASAIDCAIHQSRVQISHQVTKTLCIQALLPLCALLLAVTCLIACSAEYFTRLGLSFSFTRFLTYPVPWIPVLNPLITLIVIRPYRKFLLCRANKVNVGSNGIAVSAGKEARRGNAYVHSDLIT